MKDAWKSLKKAMNDPLEQSERRKYLKVLKQYDDVDGDLSPIAKMAAYSSNLKPSQKYEESKPPPAYEPVQSTLSVSFNFNYDISILYFFLPPKILKQ